MDSDPWLLRWLPLVAERGLGKPVLELGCGSGRDSVTLAKAGHSLVAIELSPEAIAEAKAAVPGGQFHCQDIRVPFPLGEESVGVVVASLSLHYFPWEETVALVERIRTTLTSKGILLCRVNSGNDNNYGASGHPAISHGYFMVAGEAKRFFDTTKVDELFVLGWRVLAKQEMVIHRYALPKVVWEVVLERVEG